MSAFAFIEWVEISAFLLTIGVIPVAALVGIIWLMSKPLGSGPQRIVDVENRGHTRIRMPDGTIR
jgi:hypothetical protein